VITIFLTSVGIVIIMLSGISSQIGGLIGSVKKSATGQPEDATAATTDSTATPPVDKDPVNSSASVTSPVEGEGNNSAVSSASR